MVQEARVTCVGKTGRLEPYDRIRSLGGGLNLSWEISHERAIDLIEHDGCRLYTCNTKGDRLYLVVVTSADGHKYVKTVADNVHPENLLNLPECPPRRSPTRPAPAARQRTARRRPSPSR